MDQVLKMRCFSSVNERQRFMFEFIGKRKGNTCLILFDIKTRKSAHSSMQSHLNIVYSAKTLIITHSGVNTAP